MTPLRQTSPNLSAVQLGRNLAANLLSLTVGMISGLILTPYWIRTFGVGPYGLVPLIQNVVVFLSLATLVLNASVSRMIAIAIGQNDRQRAELVFNTSLWGAIGIAILILPLGAGLSIFADSLIRVPAGCEYEVRWMLLLAVGAFLVTAISTPFGVAGFCANRLDLNSSVEVFSRFLYIAISVLLVVTVCPSPMALSCAGLATALVAGFLFHRIWRRLMPWMRMRFVFDWAVFREQVNFGGWILVNQIGAILFLYVDLLVVNRLLGPNAGGQYAAILQWSILLRMFSTAVGSIFQPQMLYLFAQHNLHELAVFSQRAVRVLGLMLGIPVIWISGLAVPLLTTWAGPSFATFGPLLLLATAHLCVNLAVTPLFFTQQVLNKVRIPAAVNLLMGVLNVGLALLLAGSYHWGMHGVAAAGMIVLTAKNTIFTTVYTATVLGRRRYWFAGQVGLTAALTVIFVLPLYVLTTWLNLAGWPRLIGAGTAASLIYLLAVWRWFLPVEDRAVVRQQVAHLWSTMPLARAKQASDT